MSISGIGESNFSGLEGPADEAESFSGLEGPEVSKWHVRAGGAVCDNTLSYNYCAQTQRGRYALYGSTSKSPPSSRISMKCNRPNLPSLELSSSCFFLIGAALFSELPFGVAVVVVVGVACTGAVAVVVVGVVVAVAVVVVFGIGVGVLGDLDAGADFFA